MPRPHPSPAGGPRAGAGAAYATQASHEAALRPVDQIVVPIEGTDREFFAQQWAVEFAASLGVPVLALHVGPPGGDQAVGLFTYVSQRCRERKVTLRRRVLEGPDPVDELVAELSPRDLVFIGSRQMAHEFHLGSVAAGLVRRAPCPVQVVRIE